MNENSGNVLLKSTISPSESRRFTNSRVFLWAALIAGVLFAARCFGSEPLRELLQWISGLGSTAPLVFIPLYVVACVLFIPGSILTLSAGFLFGVVRGSIYVSVAATLGATLAFLIGRDFARQWVASRLANYPKFKAVDEAVAPRRMENRSAHTSLSSVSFQPAELRLRPNQRRSARLRTGLMGRDAPRHDSLRIPGLTCRRPVARRDGRDATQRG
jgi:hypothetical protein